MRSVFASILAVLGCSSAMDVQTIRYAEAGEAIGPQDCRPRLLGGGARISEGCVPIGDVFVGDTVFSTNCGLRRVREEVARETCSLGGNTAQIRQLDDAISNCMQVRAQVYRCPNGDPGIEPSEATP